MFGKLHSASGKPFRDIARIINPDKEEGNAPRRRRIQTGQAVTDLLKTGTKPASKQIKIIAQLLCRLEKSVIGHHHGRGKISSQCHP